MINDDIINRYNFISRAGCVETPIESYTGMGGHERFRAKCATCGVRITGWSHIEVMDKLLRHATIPAPPDDILARPLTRDILKRYADYYFEGRGRPILDAAECHHGWKFTDSPCDMCNMEEESETGS